MKRRIDLPQVEEVTLPELLHMRPGIYILILLVLALLLALFLIAFYPGIRNGGRYVTFTGSLSESGVLLDGTYLGSAEYQHFVKSGSYEVSLTKGGEVYARFPLEIDHPVFLTWLFHRTLATPEVPLSLSKEQRKAINRFNLEQIVQASAILSYDDRNNYPPLFANLIADMKAMELEEQTIKETLELALLYISNATMLDEALQAIERHQFALDGNLQIVLETAKELFASSSQPKTMGMRSSPLAFTAQKTVLKAGDLQIEGYHYPKTTFVMGKEVLSVYPETTMLGVEVSTEAFSLATLESTQYQWALFLEENPTWEASNRQALMEEQLVDEYYMQGLSVSPVFVTSRPIFQVSYHAAQAFCDWLSVKSGKQVFLPTEAMYTLAALSHPNLKYSSSLSPSPSVDAGPVALLGGVWEMTSSPYIPLSRVYSLERSRSLHQHFGLSVQPIVKGGSYLNESATVSLHTVGVVESDACADQIGFRIAWYE
ncbi:MAG: SUMF1/EgtB/PvdO family nonheme iron enzyme [Sphaerochaeta sp.]|nr:SUMF1/EgtB/PvdO family nonheme iron enzyme [Sphaerochaeta sp.]